MVSEIVVDGLGYLVPIVGDVVVGFAIAALGVVLQPLLEIYAVGCPASVADKFIDYLVVLCAFWCGAVAHEVSSVG